MNSRKWKVSRSKMRHVAPLVASLSTLKIKETNRLNSWRSCGLKLTRTRKRLISSKHCTSRAWRKSLKLTRFRRRFLILRKASLPTTSQWISNWPNWLKRLCWSILICKAKLINSKSSKTNMMMWLVMFWDTKNSYNLLRIHSLKL